MLSSYCVCVCILLPTQHWYIFPVNNINSIESYLGLRTFLLILGLFLSLPMTKSNSTFDCMAYCLFKICLYFTAL
jgi:hypothetical protein